MGKSMFLQTEVDGEIISTRELYGNLKLVHLDDLQVVWEQLNGVLYDLTQGAPSDAVEAVEDCIGRLESILDSEVKE